MEKLIISMIGENLHGKVLSSFLNKNGIIHKCIIEKGTSRSKKREQWLKPNHENFSIESEILFVKNIEGDSVIEIYNDFDGYIINGGLPILKKNILDLPKKGFLNAHPGILPKYRGQNPVQWSIHNFDPVGATIHLIDENIDTGPILIKKELEKFESTTINDLRLEVLKFSASLLVEYLLNINKYPPSDQKLQEGNNYPIYPKKNNIYLENRLKKIGKLINKGKKL